MTHTLELPTLDTTIAVDFEGELERLEAIIEEGLPQFIEVGLALLEIRQRELYRLSHRTWTDYLRERWDMSDSRARQLISAAKDTVTDVTVLEDGTVVMGDGESVPETEGEARRRSRERRQREVAGTVTDVTLDTPPATHRWFEATRRAQSATRTLIQSGEVATLPLEVVSNMRGRIIALNGAFAELDG